MQKRAYLASILVISVTLITLLLFKTAESKEIDPLVADQLIQEISSNKISINKIPKEYLDDKEFVLKLLSEHMFILKDLPEKYHDDFDVMSKVANLQGALKYASDRLKDDEKLVNLYIESNGSNIRYASTRLQKSYRLNKEVINASVKQHHSNFEHIPNIFKNDEEFVLELARANPSILRLNFKLKESSSFQEKIQNMLINGQIPFDENGEYKTIPFLNLLYFSDYVKDDGLTLSLKLKNGEYKKIKYIQGKKTGHPEGYYAVPNFLGYIKDYGFYVVAIDYEEGFQVYLIDDITGKEAAQIDEYPKFSPDGNYIATSISVDAYAFGGIEIFQIKPHEIKSVFRYEEDHCSFDSWLRNGSFRIIRAIKNQPIANQPKYIIIKKMDNKWIEEAMPKFPLNKIN